MILCIVDNINFISVFCYELFNDGFLEFCIFAPFIEIGCIEFVTENAERSVVRQPTGISFKERLERSRGKSFLALLCENLFNIFVFSIIHTLIIYSLERIEFFGKTAIVFATRFVSKFTKRLQA